MAILAGCEQKPPPAATRPDPKKETKSAGDAKLEAAMAAASASAAKKPAAQESGPPASGIFAPGAADKAMAKGAEPKVELMSDGAEPRVALLSSADAWKGSAVVSVGVRLGQRNALPSIDYTVALGPEKRDKKDAKDAPPPGPLSLFGEVTQAKLSAEQPGKLPDGVQKEIAKLKGSKLIWKSSEQGVAREPSSAVSKDGQPELSRSLDAAAETMFYLSVPPPPKPVGVGASWIAGSRQVLSGVEVISYRLYKVTAISPTGVTLSLESHEYAVSDAIDFQGLPKGATMAQFEGTAQGEITLPAKESLAIKGKVARQSVLGMKAEGGPQGGMMGLQIVFEGSAERSAK